MHFAQLQIYRVPSTTGADLPPARFLQEQILLSSAEQNLLASAEQAAPPNQATGAAGSQAPATSFPLGPPRLGKSIASQRKKKWRLLFSGKYGSTGQLGICPHEAGLDSWCRPSSWQLGGWHHITSLAIFGRRILRNEDLSGNGFTRIRRVQMWVICKSGHQRGIAH